MNWLYKKVKTSFFTVVVFLFSLQTMAQSPLQFNFQAVARERSGNVMNEKDIKVRLTIRNEAKTGNAEYSEVRSVRTNEFGMFTIAIGSPGAFLSTGSLVDVEWGRGNKYLQVEVDANGGNNFIDLGSTQLLSVPFALYSLKTAGSSNGAHVSANNGLSITDSTLQIGNDEDGSGARLLNSRQIPLNGHAFRLSDGGADIKFTKGLITFQQDSIPIAPSISGGTFMKINPIHPGADAVPFLFTNSAVQQHGGTTSPNHVVGWGYNIAAGGGPLLTGLPGIGYSLESNYIPWEDSRFVESHELYLTPEGKQIRLKSYTIDTKANIIDFYHSTDNFYLKNPWTGKLYFLTQAGKDLTETHYITDAGSFHIATASDKSVSFQNNYEPGNRNFVFNNWDNIIFPNLILSENANQFKVRTIPETDYSIALGDHSNRWADVSSHLFRGERMILKSKWLQNDDIKPTATLDLAGDDGFSQFRMRASYTPTSSNDPNGEKGAISWDDDYIYIKTSAGWKRSALSSF